MIRQIGDQVWLASYSERPIEKPCPVCFGNLKVTLILGNGDNITLPCDYCGHGFREPTGLIVEHEYVARAESIVISEVRILKDSVEYRAKYRILQGEDTSDTKKAALNRSMELANNQRYDDETRAENIKARIHKTYSWNAGYHMRAVTQAKKEIAHHEKMAQICNQRKKEEK